MATKFTIPASFYINIYYCLTNLTSKGTITGDKSHNLRGLKTFGMPNI